MADPELVQRAYTAILRHNVERGVAPHYTQLARDLGVSPDDARELQREAAGAVVGCWISHDTDYVHSWAPFSNLPTQYRIRVDGAENWYAQCGLEALAVRWLFPGQEVQIDAPCLDCGEPIRLRFRDDAILELDPPEAVAHTVTSFAGPREYSSAYR